MNIKRHLFTMFCLAISPFFYAQVITIDNETAIETDFVTITFDAKQGSGVLNGFTGDVYAFTGVLTPESADSHDWKHVQGTWGFTPNLKCKMTPIGNSVYTISFIIKDFYGLAENEKVNKLAFGFVNSEFSITEFNSDHQGLFVSIKISHENTGNYLSSVSDGNSEKITTDKGTWTLKFIKNDIVKMDYKPAGSIISDTSFTVLSQAEVVTLTKESTNDFIDFSSSDLKVRMTKNPVKFSFIVGSDTLLTDKYGLHSATEGGGGSFKIENTEELYGTGSRATSIDRKGKVLSVYNSAHYGYMNNTPDLNISIPFVISSKGYGLFIDNQYPMELDLGATNSTELRFNCEDGNLRYYFLGGGNYSNVLKNYTELTGRQELPPIWTLGYIQSKYGYQTETEARNIVTKLRNNKFPVEGLVLDLYWFGGQNNMGNLDWSYPNFPNPIQMMSDFKALDVKTILITEPYFSTSSTNYDAIATNNLLAKKADKTPYVLDNFWACQAGLIDITKKEAVDWMWTFYKARCLEGVSGWWSDLGEPELHPNDMVHELGSARAVHNVYSLQWAKMLKEGYENDMPNERLFNLIRSGFAGMQRYSTFAWSGDVNRDWSGLEAQVPIMLGAGMTGIGYMHSDAGGFTGPKNNELYTRWIQMAAFTPILRIHGTSVVEPTNYVDPYKSIVRNYIDLRYRLLPYNYTLAYENSQTGIPMARQSDFYEPENTSLKNLNDQYLWGDAFLIAPVMSSGIASRTVVFPTGDWFDFSNNLHYTAGSHLVPTTLNVMPIFVKGGAFIPMATSSIKNTSKFTTDSLEILYYPCLSKPNSEYTMYCDNGIDRNSISTNSFELLNFNGFVSGETVSINVSKSTSTFSESPVNRNMRFRVKRMDLPTSVSIEGGSLNKVLYYTDFTTNSNAWLYDVVSKEVVVNMSWSGQQNEIVISGLLTSDRSNKSGNASFYLNPPVPNPVVDDANFNYYIENEGNYTLSFYNTTGSLVKLVELDNLLVGEGNYEWDTASLAPGVYLVSLSNGTQSVSVKVVKQ